MILDADVLYFLLTLVSLLVFIPVPFVMLEPPKRLFKSGKVDELFKTLYIISLRNKKELTIEDIQQESGVEEVNLELAKCRLDVILTFREKLELMKQGMKMLAENLMRIILFTFVCGSTFIVYYGITYNSGKIGLPSVQMDVIF